MSASQIDVEHLFTITVKVGDTSNALIRGGPSGSRLIAAVEGGTFSGDRLSGTVIPPGGDWVTLRDDRSIKLDVRILLVTDDGESILMTYQGIGIPSEDGPTQLRTAPSFETGAEAYAWLNNVQAVGIGTSENSVVSYEVYALK